MSPGSRVRCVSPIHGPRESSVSSTEKPGQAVRLASGLPVGGEIARVHVLQRRRCAGAGGSGPAPGLARRRVEERAWCHSPPARRHQWVARCRWCRETGSARCARREAGPGWPARCRTSGLRSDRSWRRRSADIRTWPLRVACRSGPTAHHASSSESAPACGSRRPTTWICARQAIAAADRPHRLFSPARLMCAAIRLRRPAL